MKQPAAMGIISLFTLLSITTYPLTGCSGSRTSRVTTTEVHRESVPGSRTDQVDQNYNNSDDRVVVTKTEDTSKESSPRGLFGIIGDIIALPFRALSSLL